MSSIQAEVIAVGTEILLGQIVNTNATVISKKLQELSVPCYFQSVVGDNEERLLKQFELASSRSNLIIVCGGIGPTKDDLTKQTLAKFLNKPLVYHQATKQKIENYYKMLNQEMPLNNLNQAFIFDEAEPFLNTNGMAVGFAIVSNGVTFIVLPGPPSELLKMLEISVTPYLKEKIGNVFRSRTLRFTTIGESKLASLIDDLILQQYNPTIAIYATLGDVTVRLTANGKTEQECYEKIDKLSDVMIERLSEYFYGFDDETLVQRVVRLLKEKSLTLSVAESLTGGMCQSQIVGVSGASKSFLGGVVTYQNENKIDVLKVNQQIIEEFGAVSEQCAKEMACQVRKLFNSDIGLAFTGIAENGENDVLGVAHIACAFNNSVEALTVTVNRGRNENRLLFTINGLNLLRKILEKR